MSAAGSTDPNNDPLTYTWTFGDGGTGAGLTTAHTYAAAGTYTVSVTATDPSNASHTASTTATITPPPPTNQPPTADAGGPYTGFVGQPVAMSAAASTDPNNDPLTAVWNFGDGGTGTGLTTAHTYAAAGTYSVSVTATDPSNASHTASTTATISVPDNRPPTVTATIPSAGLVAQNMVFNATGSDLDGDVLTYRWDFGDGSPVASAPTAGVVHEYGTAGTYAVTLTVDDGRGGTASASGAIAITLPPRPVAFPQNLIIYPRQNQGLYLSQYAIGLDGAGVPPLQFKIVSFPSHIAADWTTGLDLIANRYYQWWNPFVDWWYLECRRMTTIPTWCKATFGSHVDLTPDPVTDQPSGTVIMNPATAPPTVLYAPERCWVWIGPQVDSFSFTVTDATGAVSDPAVIDITVNVDAGCIEPSF
jgi:PKD repeat protein